jgi:hypothetical protein
MAISAPQQTGVANSIALGLRYGPNAGVALQRSQYLADALRALQAGGNEIRTPGALGTSLLAEGLTQYAKKKADKDALGAVAKDRESQIAAALDGLGGPAPQAPPVEPSAPAPAQPPPVAPPAPQAPAQASAGAQDDPSMRIAKFFADKGYSPAQAAGIGGNFKQESGYNPAAVNSPEGGIGLGQWNGSRKAALVQRFGPNPTLDQQLQFTADELAGPEASADKALRAAQDPVAAAQAFAGFERPAGWRPGGDPQAISGWQNRAGEAQRLAQALAGQQQPQAQQAPLQPVQPFQVASMGPTPMPAQAPPAPNPLAPQGATPAAVSPAAGGIVSPEEIALAKRLMQNPETFDQGRQMALELQKQQAAGPKYQPQVVNGVLFDVDPRTHQAVQVSTPGSHESVKSAQELGIPAPPGTMFNVDPNGKATSLYQPPAGYQAGGPGQQSFVPGGPADPNQGQNRLEGLRNLRQEVKPVLDLATSLRRNYSAVQTGYQQQNGSGDIAMVNGLQKLIDEGVVREGDVNLQLNAQGIKGGLAQAQAYITSSGKFSPEIRKGILNTADSLYGNINSTYKDRILGYRGIAEHAYGPGAFGEVVPSETVKALGWDAAEAPHTATTSPGGFSPAQRTKAQEIMKNRPAGQLHPGTMADPHVPVNKQQYDALPKGAWFIDDDGALVQKGAR